MTKELDKQASKNRLSFTPNKFEDFRKYLKVNFYYCSLSKEHQPSYIDIKPEGRYYKPNIKFFSEGKIKQKKTFKYDITQFESDYNIFANSFQLKKNTAFATCLTIYILCILTNKKLTIKEILDSFSYAEDKTIKEKIKSMVEYGLILTDGKKYFIEENRLYTVDEELLLRLLNMTDLVKNIVYPETLGYNLFNVLKAVYEDRTGYEYSSPFQFKYSHLANTLDDNVLWSLIEAIEQRQCISFTYGKKKKENIIPVKIFTENEYNRYYLFAVTAEPFKFHIFRLSEIYDLQLIRKAGAVNEEEFLKFLDIYKSEKKYSFSGKMDSNAKTVTLRLKYKNSRKLKAQIKNDFNSVKFDKDNTAIVTVKNKKIIKPYLRANMGLIETTDTELSEMINSEIEEMKKNYGII